MSDAMKCPYCSEEIKADAKKCRYCGEWLTQEAAARQGSGPMERGTADARAVAKGIKEYEASKSASGCLTFLALVAAVFVGVYTHWLLGLGVFIFLMVLITKQYYKE